MAFPRSDCNVMGRQVQASELMSYWWWTGLSKLTGYVLLLTSDVHDSTDCPETEFVGHYDSFAMAQSEYLSYHSILISHGPVSLPYPSLVWSVDIPRSPLTIQSWEKELKELVWLWLLSEVSMNFDDFHTEIASYSQRSSSLKKLLHQIQPSCRFSSFY